MTSIIGGMLITRSTDTELFNTTATTFTLTNAASSTSPVTPNTTVILKSLRADAFCRAGEIDVFRTALVCDAATAAEGLALKFVASKLYLQGFPLVATVPGQLALFDFSGTNFDQPFVTLGELLQPSLSCLWLAVLVQSNHGCA